MNSQCMISRTMLTFYCVFEDTPTVLSLILDAYVTFRVSHQSQVTMLFTFSYDFPYFCVNSIGKKSGHIPYRDSKLTRILQPSVGGNSRTAIICTMSPALSHVEQTKNTLSFATRAKEVTNSAKVNLVCISWQSSIFNMTNRE